MVNREPSAAPLVGYGTKPLNPRIFMTENLINDEDIQALVDGELSAPHDERVMKAVLADPWLRERYDFLRRQKAALLSWWQDGHSNH